MIIRFDGPVQVKFFQENYWPVIWFGREDTKRLCIGSYDIEGSIGSLNRSIMFHARQSTFQNGLLAKTGWSSSREWLGNKR